jgi:hypothetical protein
MSDQSAIKIVIDTNIWISFLIGKRLSSLVDAIPESTVEIFLSGKLKDEINRVIQYPRLKDKISKD